MTDLYSAMLDAQYREAQMGDVMIEARRVYYARLDEYDGEWDPPYHPGAPSTQELSTAYEAAYNAWEQAHKVASEALLAWLKTVR